jgi:DNA-binding HxlR family transcriptional regulator
MGRAVLKASAPAGSAGTARDRLDPGCRAFQAAIDVLARPWSGLLLGLLSGGGLRFSELEERAAGVGAKTLSARLKELEGRGLVLRSVDVGPPIRVRYALTAKGRAFEHVAEAIQRWGRQLVDEPDAAAPRRGRDRAADRAQRSRARRD